MKKICLYIFLISILALPSVFPLIAQVGGIEGKVVYAQKKRIRVHILGDKNFVELGLGEFARWSPDGNKVAVKYKKTIYVINADGSNRVDLVDDAGGDDNCPLEFHTNGREILYIRKDNVMAVDIHTKEKRVVVDYLDSTGEIGIDASGRRLVSRDGHIVRAIDLETRKYTIFGDDHCSAAISPDGNYVTFNDNGKPHHLWVHILKLNENCTDFKEYRKVSHSVMPGEIMGDNHHWSNHNDWITCEGDKKRNGMPYMINVVTQKGYAMADVDGVKYPDLWVDTSAE